MVSHVSEFLQSEATEHALYEHDLYKLSVQLLPVPQVPAVDVQAQTLPMQRPLAPHWESAVHACFCPQVPLTPPLQYSEAPHCAPEGS